LLIRAIKESFLQECGRPGSGRLGLSPFSGVICETLSPLLLKVSKNYTPKTGTMRLPLKEQLARVDAAIRSLGEESSGVAWDWPGIYPHISNKIVTRASREGRIA
jgi:hypothetical protein